LPGIPGKTENLRVTSIVGRFLEHPRVFIFGSGPEAKVYIGSADMMTRNTEKRVEVACPIYDETIRRRLKHCMKVMLSDSLKARWMRPDGTYMMKDSGGEPQDAQAVFMREELTARMPAEEKRGKERLMHRVLGLFRKQQ